MSGAYAYKPKFVDIRVRPPKPGAEDGEAAAYVDPPPAACDHPGCNRPAEAEAPKSRDRPQDRYHFCLPHAAEYNRGWDYFEGMTEGEIRAHQAASLTGDRPTWAFKASAGSREAAAFAAKMARGESVRDAFGMFGPGGRADRPAAAAPSRHLGRLERAAFVDMDLDEAADGPAIRARYLELVKRFHPDSNGGDRSTEQKLGRVIKAYKTLRAAKLA